MPVNTFGSNLRVETNINGAMVDNEEFVQYKNNYNHHHHPSEPWQQGTTAEVQEELLQDILMPKSEPVEPDPALIAAHRKDLKIRNLNQ
jgi:hypothetical protein